MYTQRKPIENTHIVRERDRERFRELLAVFSLGIPVALFLLLFTWQNLEVIRLGREANGLQRNKARLEDTNKNLQLELERMTDLAAVEANARRLGLQRTGSSDIVLVTRGDESVRPLPTTDPQQ